MILTWQQRNTRWKTCRRATLLTTNPTRIDPSQINSFHNPTHFWRAILTVSSHLRLYLASATLSTTNPTRTNPSQINSFHAPTHFWRSILILLSQLQLYLASGLFPSGLHTRTLYALLPYPTHATRLAHLILLDHPTIRQPSFNALVAYVNNERKYQMIFTQEISNHTTANQRTLNRTTSRKLRRCINCERALKQKGLKQGLDILGEESTGRSGDRIPVGAKFSTPVQTASYKMGTGSFPGVK
jgi:hypothetical protein